MRFVLIRSRSTIKLLFMNRTEEDIIWRKELDSLSKTKSGYVYTLNALDLLLSYMAYTIYKKSEFYFPSKNPIGNFICNCFLGFRLSMDYLTLRKVGLVEKAGLMKICWSRF